MSVKYSLIKKMNPQKREELKWYATPSSSTPLSGKAMTRAATANTTTAAIEMEAALELLAAYIPQQLLQGHTVKVPGLGTFRLTFGSKWVENINDFTSDLIKDARIAFTTDKNLRESVISKLAFEAGSVYVDGIHYGSVQEFLKATGSDGSAGTRTPSGGDDGGSSNGGADGGNPL
ncbi:MAG: hypothetical protein IKA75_04220 [Bacteroidaceae bacterium]|nr:hypothetical protein [Bacteroidaceae bacterium]